MPQNFNVGIKGVIVNQGKALLLKRSSILNPGKAFWDLPGGRMDKGESVEATLDRELKEEILNLKSFSRGPLLSVYRVEQDFEDGRGLVLVFFEVKTDLEGVELSPEHSEYIWVNRDELDSVDGRSDAHFNPGYRQAVEIALE